MTSDVLTRLIDAYRRELPLYEAVLEAVRAEHEAVEAGRPLGEIIPTLERKRDLLRRIDAIERDVAPERAAWNAGRRPNDAARTADLARLVDRVRDTVRRILEFEARNESAYLRQAGVEGGPGAGVGGGAGADVEERAGRREPVAPPDQRTPHGAPGPRAASGERAPAASPADAVAATVAARAYAAGANAEAGA